MASTWQWALCPQGESDQTRLVVRQRLGYSQGQGAVWRIVEPIHFVTEHKMLEGIKQRAEVSTDRALRGSRYDVTDAAIIPAPPEVVYQTLVDELSGRTQWWEPERQSRVVLGESYDEVGTMVETTVRGKWPVRFTTRTVESTFGESIRIRYVRGAFSGEGVWTFASLGEDTKLSYRWRTTPRGALRRAFARVLPVEKSHSADVHVGFRKVQAVVLNDTAQSSPSTLASSKSSRSSAANRAAGAPSTTL